MKNEAEIIAENNELKNNNIHLMEKINIQNHNQQELHRRLGLSISELNTSQESLRGEIEVSKIKGGDYCQVEKR